MFLGHYAVGFAAKRYAPEVPLGWLLAAPLLLDLLWPIFLIFGWEEVRIAPGDTAFTPLAFVRYPWSHSFLMAVVWSAAAATLLARAGRAKVPAAALARSAAILGGAVLSHWFLDALTHRGDLQYAPGFEARVGLGMWNSVPATIAVEGVMFALGVGLYVATTRARDRRGGWGLAAFLTVSVALYLGAAFGPPPPSVAAIIAVSLGAWLMPLWAGCVDRHRAVRDRASAPGAASERT